MSRSESSIAARKQLADKYDKQAKQRTEMAQMAKELGAGNVAQNLGNLADKSKTYAKRARKK